MKYDRRELLVGAAGLAAFLSKGQRPAQAASRAPAKAGVQTGERKDSGTRLILLGTKGGPSVAGARKNPSTLLMINGTPYLIDCGYCASRQLWTAGVPLNKLRYIFITHHHSDHNLDYGAVLYNTWNTGPPPRVDAYGPPGLLKMTENCLQFSEFDIGIRMQDEGYPDMKEMVFPHEFDKPGVIMENDDVKVTAALVRHPPIKHSYAFRFDTPGRSVVISGDTTYAPELASFAKGADVLVHEVMYLPALEEILKGSPDAAKLRAHLLASHTVCEDVGKIAAQAEVGTLVLTHFVPGGDQIRVSDLQWTEDIRKHYHGPIIVGRDLMEI